MVLHPDWNIAKGHYEDVEFKPAIARYDWDQTYDVLEFVHLPSGFDEIFGNLGIPAFELIAIDRYTPHNYIWAEEYSDYVFNLLKQFNFCPHIDLYQNNGLKDQNFLPYLSPAFSFGGDKYDKTAEYEVALDSGKYKITCFIYQGQKEGVIGSITTLNQASYTFTLDETTTVDFNSIINNLCKDDYDGGKQWQWQYNDGNWGDDSTWEFEYVNKFCVNSLVLSKLNGSQWESVTPDSVVHKFLFYSDLEEYWGLVETSLKQYFNYPTTKTIQFSGKSDEYFSQDLYYLAETPLQHWTTKTEIKDLTFYNNQNKDVKYSLTITRTPLPSYITEHCYLQRANNNCWKTGIEYSDLGIIPVNKLNNNFLYFNLRLVKGEMAGATTTPTATGYIIKNDRMVIDVEKFDGDEGPFLPQWQVDYSDNTIVLSEGWPYNTYYNYFKRLATLPPWGLDFVFEDVQVQNHSWEIRQPVNGMSVPTYTRPPSVSEAIDNIFEGYNVGWGYGFNRYVYFSPIYRDSIEINYYTNSLNSTYNQKPKLERSYEVKSHLIYYITFRDSIWDRFVEPTRGGESPPTEWGQESPSIATTNFVTSSRWVELYSYNSVSDEDYLDFLLLTKEQLEEYMVDSIRIKDIHACLGAGEFAFYDDNGTPTEYYMHVARNLDYLCKSFGLYYKPDGTLMDIRANINPPTPPTP